MLCIHLKLNKCNVKNTVEKNGMGNSTVRDFTFSHIFFIDMHVCVDKYVILVIHFVKLTNLFQRNIEKKDCHRRYIKTIMLLSALALTQNFCELYSHLHNSYLHNSYLHNLNKYGFFFNNKTEILIKNINSCQ